MGIFKRHIERYGTWFFVLCVAVAAWQCFAVALDTHLGGVGQAFHQWHAVAVSLAGALLLLSPYWLLPRRWRALVWIPVALLTVWCLVQVCYCRAYDDLMPLQSLMLTENVNPTLVGSTVALLRWQDLLIVVHLAARGGTSLGTSPAAGPSMVEAAAHHFGCRCACRPGGLCRSRPEL